MTGGHDPRSAVGRPWWSCKLSRNVKRHYDDTEFADKLVFTLLFCFFLRPDRKERASLHTRARNDVLENSNVHCVSASGWAATVGRTLGNSASSVTSTCIRTSRDRWTNLTDSTCRIKPRNILKISARNARALATIVAGLNRVKKFRPFQIALKAMVPFRRLLVESKI